MYTTTTMQIETATKQSNRAQSKPVYRLVETVGLLLDLHLRDGGETGRSREALHLRELTPRTQPLIVRCTEGGSAGLIRQERVVGKTS